MSRHPLRHRALRTLVSTAALLAAVAGSVGSVGAQTCPTPSDLSLRPGAEPLRVALTPAGDLSLTWETVAADRYVVYRGSLAGLGGAPAYDHAVLAEVLTPDLLVPSMTGSSYYLVSAACGADESSTGSDSSGGDRPFGGRAVVTVGVAGGSGVFGVSADLRHPAFSTAIEEADVEVLGPFAPGSPGSPLTSVGVVPPDLVAVIATFTVFAPDPSFAPPAAPPVELFRFAFRTVGLPPAPADFVLESCSVRDDFGNPIAATACTITSVVVD